MQVFGLMHAQLHALIRSKQRHPKLVCLAHKGKQNSVIISQSSPPALGPHITQGRKNDFKGDVLGKEQPLQHLNEPLVPSRDLSSSYKQRKKIKGITSAFVELKELTPFSLEFNDVGCVCTPKPIISIMS